MEIYQDDSPDQRDLGPQKLFQSLIKSNYDLEFIEDKHLLGNRSKFKSALDALQQDFRPSSSVSCRDSEKQTIQNYLRQSLTTQGCSESLYISGVPGIGKTLCVKEIVRKMQKQFSDSMKAIYTNALCIKKPLQIFRTIYYELTGQTYEPTTSMYKLNQMFEKGVPYDHPANNRYANQFLARGSETKKEKQKFAKMKKVLILDELDYLLTRDEDVLYTLFDWSQKKKSQLIIISISNTLDFPEHLSPKVNSRIGNKRLFFKPYQSWQIQSILNERIKHLDVFDETALTYICKKIVQCSSDIRKCLYVLRQSILQFIYHEKTHKKNLKDEDIKHKKITAEILTKIHDRVYRDHLVNIFHEFPACYKIILYFLAKHFKSQNTACTMRKLEHMCQSWTKGNSQLLSTLCDLKQLGIIKIVYGKISKQRRTFSDYVDMKQLSEENIILKISYERIIYALQKENLNQLSKNSFQMNLNF